MSSEQPKRMPRPSRSTGSANGEQSAGSRDGQLNNPALMDFNSKIKRFPVHLLPGILSSHRSNAESPKTAFQPIAHPGVTRCLKFIGRNPRFKLCDLVDVSGLSRRGLHKAFVTHLGCAPGAVAVMMRLWIACDLLANSRLPVARIATSCGYRSGNSLYVALQRYFGTTPQRVRRRSHQLAVLQPKR